jgi:hypothetical protein
MDFIATRAEVIIEDDEDLSSLCFWRSQEPGAYFCICAEVESHEIYCEFCEQINGFVSKTISYQRDGDRFIFRLSSGETFDKAHIVTEKGGDLAGSTNRYSQPGCAR